MSGIIAPLQVSAVDALLIAADVVAIVADTPAGPAVFAPRQPFFDVFPRVTLGPPQIVRFGGTAFRGRECYLTVHSWARGAEATLQAGALAEAVHDALMVNLTISGWEISTHRFEGTQSAGDPDETVEHLVSVFRYLAAPAA